MNTTMLRRAPIQLLLLTGLASPAGAQTHTMTGGERCTATVERDAGAWLARAERAAWGGGEGPLRLRVVTAESQDYQSDRTYPPYLFAMQKTELWYDAAAGVERTSGETTFPFGEYPLGVRLSDGQRTFVARRDSLMPAAQAHGTTLQTRPLNAWAVLHDWRGASDVTIERMCRYRDYPRLVLARKGAYGTERLYLDPKTALPLRLARAEPHSLFGTVHVDYVYSNWVEEAGRQYPMASFRMVDGRESSIRTAAPLPVSKDSVPTLTLPAGGGDMTAAATAPTPDFEPDTVRVGPSAFLLHTRYYSNVVALVRDTVFILDAQFTGDVRAQRDSAWIGRLFPGRHPLVLVVSDLAFPHIAGVRYWVANGATVVSHTASRAFLERVVQRRWRERPDLLERRRPAARFRFVGVDGPRAFAGGAVQVIPIDGIGSEGSVMTYLAPDRFLFAGDYVQRVDQPTSYGREVWQASRRAGITPDRLAAMHLPLTPWAALERVAGDSVPAAGR